MLSNAWVCLIFCSAAATAYDVDLLLHRWFLPGLSIFCKAVADYARCMPSSPRLAEMLPASVFDLALEFVSKIALHVLQADPRWYPNARQRMHGLPATFLELFLSSPTITTVTVKEGEPARVCVVRYDVSLPGNLSVQILAIPMPFQVLTESEQRQTGASPTLYRPCYSQ